MGTGFGDLVATLTLAVCFILRSYAASHYHHQQQQLPSAMVEGTVHCNTCFRQDFSEFSHPIPGASVELRCYRNGKNKLGFKKKLKTNRHGVFRFRLPLGLSRNVKVIETCSVKLVRSRRSICSMASPETSVGRRLRLKSRRHGVRVFSAGGFIASRPLKQPEACNHESRPSVSVKYLLFSRKRVMPAFLFPPPIPFLPSPPNFGGIPLPPNPLQPPPSIVPPLPFQPSPPPFSFLPPLPFQPSPPPFSFLPPLPFLPSPPPFSVLPPLPFQPPQPPFSNFPPLPSIPPFPNIPPLPSMLQPPPPPPPAFLFPPLPLPPFFPGNPPAASAQGNNK